MTGSSTRTSIFLGALLFCVCNAAAGHAASASPANFDQRKSEQLRRIDARITRLQDERACVRAATTQDGMKNYREKFKTVNRSRQS